MSYINGYDFSSIDNVDVTALPQGTGFVALRAIRQNGQQDTTFQNRYHALRDNRPEIVRIPYLFLNWYKSGSEQAQSLLDLQINFQRAGTGAVAIDLEADSGSDIEKYIMQNRAVCVQIVNDCIAYFRSNASYGRQDIIIYSNDSFLRDTIAHTWPDCIFWLSSYQNNLPGNPAQPVKIWQKCQFGRLDMTCGQDSSYGSYDLDYYLGLQEELNALANIQINS